MKSGNESCLIRKIAFSGALLFAMVGEIAASHAEVILEDSNFSMNTPDPGVAFGGANNVKGIWDGTLNTNIASTNFNMTLSSTTPFFGIPWTAHHIRVFGPGTYIFESGCSIAQLESGVAACGGATMTMTVNPGQMGGHMLFNWNGNNNIDVVNVWDINAVYDGGAPDSRMWTGGTCAGTNLPCKNALKDTKWFGASTDVDGDSVPSLGMVDGPFSGYNANFNLRVLLSAMVDIGPKTLNVKSQGDGFSVSFYGIQNTDGSAINLSGVAEGVRISSIGDSVIAADAITEIVANRTFDGTTLTVSFNRQLVIPVVSSLPDGSVVSICVRGDVTDSHAMTQRFKGCNNITVLNKGI
jgi:hypothetical protein